MSAVTVNRKFAPEEIREFKRRALERVTRAREQANRNPQLRASESVQLAPQYDSQISDEIERRSAVVILVCLAGVVLLVCAGFILRFFNNSN